MNKVQRAAIILMRNDLRFLYTILANRRIATSSYYVALIPYMGLIIDGIEDWVKAYNNSSKCKINVPTFTEKEQLYYEEMRNSIKMFETGFLELDNTLKENYEKSDQYFSSLCKPIAKQLNLYDVYGVFRCNSIPCDNTILDQCIVPFFEFGDTDGESMKQIAAIGGKYIVCFDALAPYEVNESFEFDTKDFGGGVKSPYGSHYNLKFFMFSILCQINFVLVAVDQFIKDETTTKLRFAYILYYYLLRILPVECYTVSRVDKSPKI